MAFILTVREKDIDKLFHRFKVYLKDEKELIRTLRNLNKDKYFIDGDIETTCDFVDIKEVTHKTHGKKHIEFGR